MTTTRTRTPAPSAAVAIQVYVDKSRRHARTGPLAPPRTHDLAALDHLGAVWYDLMCQEIVTLRSAGCTWQVIADALDVSRQAAWLKWRHVDPTTPDASGRRNNGSRRTS